MPFQGTFLHFRGGGKPGTYQPRTWELSSQREVSVKKPVEVRWVILICYCFIGFVGCCIWRCSFFFARTSTGAYAPRAGATKSTPSTRWVSCRCSRSHERTWKCHRCSMPQKNSKWANDGKPWYSWRKYLEENIYLRKLKSLFDLPRLLKFIISEDELISCWFPFPWQIFFWQDFWLHIEM